MIGMTLGAFLVLLVLGLIAAGVLHFVVRYRFFEGFDGFFAKWIAGWVGAWLGSPVMGHWSATVKYADVYIIPALIGAFAAAFISTAYWKALSAALSHKHE